MKSQLSQLILLPLCFCLIASTALAQRGDTVYRANANGVGSTKISGKVVDMTPMGILVESKGSTTTIPAGEVRNVVYANQANSITRTADRIKSGSYAQGIEEIAKIDDKGNPFVAHELAFLKAYAEGNLALKGSFDAIEAGKSLSNFLAKYKKSYHFFPATELKGRLLYSLKFPDLAAKEFKRLTQSDWPEYVIKGNYYLAQTAIAQKNFDGAITSCDQILASTDNDDVTRQYQLLAKCLKAKAQTLSGNPGSAESDLKQIIKVENPDNQELFAAAYNALGVYHFKANQLKEAREKFLLTHLLMYSESESHAEALYYLAQIWPQLGNTDEANKTRELLKSRYRNSYWAKILN